MLDLAICLAQKLNIVLSHCDILHISPKSIPKFALPSFGFGQGPVFQVVLDPKFSCDKISSICPQSSQL